MCFILLWSVALVIHLLDLILPLLIICQDKTRKATGPQMDVLEDGYVDHELFSLSAIKVLHFCLQSVCWIFYFILRARIKRKLVLLFIGFKSILLSSHYQFLQFIWLNI